MTPTNSKNLNPHMLSDIKKEFFTGVSDGGRAVLVAAASARANVDGTSARLAGVAGGALSIGALSGIGASVVVTGGALAIGSSAAAGVVAAGVIGIALDQERAKPTEPHPAARKLGYAFGLAVPIAIGSTASIYTYYKVHEEPTPLAKTAQAPVTCSRDATLEEIKKLEASGFKIELNCK